MAKNDLLYEFLVPKAALPLLKKYNAKVAPLHQLPRNVQQGIAERESDIVEITPEEFLVEEQALMRCYGYAEIPMKELTKLVMSFSEFKEDHKTFESYHRAYLRDGKLNPGHDTTKPLWPVILDSYVDTDQAFEDGWHRFHDYYRKGVQVVPVAFYVSSKKGKRTQIS